MMHLFSTLQFITVVLACSAVDGFGISSTRKLFRNPSTGCMFFSELSPGTETETLLIDNMNDLQSRSISDTIQELLDTSRRLGPVGVHNTIHDQERIQSMVTQLKQQVNEAESGVTNKNFTNIPLVGVHDLIYSAAPGGSSGKIGPFAGTVTQTFVNATTFINAVNFGPLDIALTASRRIKDDSTFIVKFEYTTVKLFGVPILEKSMQGQGGVWNVIYTGIIYDKNANDKHQKRLLRIMETPSLFVIEQAVS